MENVLFLVSRRRTMQNHVEITSTSHFETRNVPNVANLVNLNLPRCLHPPLDASYRLSESKASGDNLFLSV